MDRGAWWATVHQVAKSRTRLSEFTSLSSLLSFHFKVFLYVIRLLIVGGSFGLREFSQIRYDAVKIKIDPELEKKLKMNKVSLESEYEKIKDSTFDDWKNIRGPRPWEDPDLLQGRNPEILKTNKTT
uniref:Cytochrome c oxidase assembly protein COX16 homolog, mitochondrial n=1 Tax=Bos indicus x Bos taurus TaxID=30522 RepID=A0A4W2D3K7_BOBOX